MCWFHLSKSLPDNALVVPPRRLTVEDGENQVDTQPLHARRGLLLLLERGVGDEEAN